MLALCHCAEKWCEEVMVNCLVAAFLLFVCGFSYLTGLWELISKPFSGPILMFRFMVFI